MLKKCLFVIIPLMLCGCTHVSENKPVEVKESVETVSEVPEYEPLTPEEELAEYVREPEYYLPFGGYQVTLQDVLNSVSENLISRIDYEEVSDIGSCQAFIFTTPDDVKVTYRESSVDVGDEGQVEEWVRSNTPSTNSIPVEPIEKDFKDGTGYMLIQDDVISILQPIENCPKYLSIVLTSPELTYGYDSVDMFCVK